MKRLLSLAGITGLLTASLFAQIQNARVEGTVADTSRAVIAGAKLTITNVKTQVKAEASSDGAGLFVFPDLHPGFYILTAESQGFRKASITNIEVNVGVTIRQDVNLEVEPSPTR